MTTLRFRADVSNLSAPNISRLREFTGLSIADIRARASAGTPLLEITAFNNNWQDERLRLVRIANDIEAGQLPLRISELHQTQEHPVTLEILRNHIAHFRQIELETQRNAMLELGEIDDPSQFVPYDDDWTR
jgi:hypothetical protein